MSIAASPVPILASRRRATRLAAASAALVGSVYFIVGFGLLDPDTIYSGDIGVQYVQSRSMAASGFRHTWLHYPGEFLDGTKQHFPFLPPFTFRSHGQREAIFPPVRALVTAPFAVAGGFTGMVLLSVVTACLVLWFTWAVSDGRWRAGLPIVLGLATWFWFYAVVPFAHAPALACGMAAIWLACRSSAPRRAVWAGVLFGIGGLVRDELLLLLPGLVFAFWHRGRRMRSLVEFAGWAFAVLAAAGAIEVFVYERPLAAHPRHAVSALRTLLNLAGSADAGVPAIPPPSLSERYDIIVHQWMTGSQSDLAIAAFVAMVIAALLLYRWTNSLVGFLAVSLVVLYTAQQDARALLAAPKFIGGLYHLSPFLVFAAFPSLSPGAAPNRLAPIVTGVTIAGFLLIAFVAVDSPAGKSLGPRILLPILPIATVLAWRTIAAYATDARLVPRAIGVVGLVVVALSAALHLGGTMPALILRNREERQVIEWIKKAPEHVVVADEEITAQLVASVYFSKAVLLAENPGRMALLGRTLEQARVPSVLLVSRSETPSFALTPYVHVATWTAGRFSVQRWQR